MRENFIPPVLFAKQHLRTFRKNARLFCQSDFHMDSGMKYLIESFYRSIREDAPVPIPYREILLTARIMDAIFDSQLRIRFNRPQLRAVKTDRLVMNSLWWRPQAFRGCRSESPWQPSNSADCATIKACRRAVHAPHD